MMAGVVSAVVLAHLLNYLLLLAFVLLPLHILMVVGKAILPFHIPVLVLALVVVLAVVLVLLAHFSVQARL
jgi:hypothetical protein